MQATGLEGAESLHMDPMESGENAKVGDGTSWKLNFPQCFSLFFLSIQDFIHNQIIESESFPSI